MSESTLTRHYRLEVRLGRAGWRWHARGPSGIEASGGSPYATREEALEDGRETLRGHGVETWDEWMDGVTDNYFDPRTQRQLVVDAAEEARRAGLTPVDPEKQAEATRKLRELEQKRTKAAQEARERTLSAPADEGLGVDGGPKKEEPAPSPLKAQRKRSAQAKKAD